MSELKDKMVSNMACENTVYHIDASSLPLSCPTADMPLWNGHPRVFLPIETTGEAVCPYCNATFILKTGNEK